MPDFTEAEISAPNVHLFLPRKPEYALRAMFWPNGVALIGASEDEGTLGHKCLKSVLAGGRFGGTVFPVNPKYEHDNPEIEGHGPVSYYFGDVTHLPDNSIDLAIVVTPPETVPGILDVLGDKQIVAAVVLSMGVDEAEISRIANHREMVVAGADSVGLLNAAHGLNVLLGDLIPLLHPPMPETGKPADEIKNLVPEGHSAAVMTYSLPPTAELMEVMASRSLEPVQYLSLGRGCCLDPQSLITYWMHDETIDVVLAQVEDQAQFSRLSTWISQVRPGKQVHLFLA